MKSNSFNICPSCIHIDTCVLTDQKSQVWSCSEYDEIQPNETFKETGAQPELQLVLA